MTVLKPCPFCGGKAITQTKSDDYSNDRRLTYTRCLQCKVRGAVFSHHQDDIAYGHNQSITAWNTRANEQQGGE